MTSVFWASLAPVLGCLLVYRFSGLKSLQPRWAAWLLVFGAGTGCGIGLASVLFVLCRLALPRATALPMWVEIGALAWATYEVFRTRNREEAVEAPPNGPLQWPLVGAAVLALVIATGIMSMVWDTNPQGNWDAWSIWNLRARFLASPDGLIARAWSPNLTGHPEYPLLMSGFIAQCWSYSQTDSGNLDSAAPLAVSYLFFLALVAIAAGGVAVLRSRSLGVLFAVAILASPTLLAEVPAQYADVPLSFYFLGAVLFWQMDQPLLAGVFAGLAAWTKDEGVLFLAAFVAFAVIFNRTRAIRMIAGAMPVAVVVFSYKWILAQGIPSLLSSSSHGALAKVTDFGRYTQIAGAFAVGFVGMRADWYHPALPILILALTLKLDGQWKRSIRFPAAIGLTMLAGYFGIYVITSADLTWHLQTSLNRLLVQVWPILLLSIFLILRTPESTIVVEETKRKDRGRKK